MDDRRFDTLARTFASAHSRRHVLKALTGGVVGAIAGFAGRHGAAADKAFVCHRGRTLSVDGHALPAHLAHGDTEGPCCLQTSDCRPGQVVTISSSGRCSCTCTTGQTACNGGVGNDGAKHAWTTSICVDNLTDKNPISRANS